MAKRLFVYPYKMTSKSAKALANALGCKRIYPDRDYSPATGDVIVNWGNGSEPEWILHYKKQIINHWKNVCYAINKGVSFDLFKQAGVKIPEFTGRLSKARSWLDDGEFVVGRQSLEGMDGYGIVFMRKPADLRECELYTLYTKKVSEYRVYVMGNSVLDCLEKRRDSDRLAAGTVDEFIRTEKNGWVFCRARVDMPYEVGRQAVKAVKALGLVFGGVDVIWNPHQSHAQVLEVNTAPGIFGDTVHRYADAIKEYASQI